MDGSWEPSCQRAVVLRCRDASYTRLRSTHATLHPWNAFEGALQSLVSSRAGELPLRSQRAMDPSQSQISSSSEAAEPARQSSSRQATMQRRAAPPRTRQPLLWIACCVASASALVAPSPRAAPHAPTRARRRIAASVVGDDLPSRPVVDGKSYGAELANAYKRCGEITKIFSKTFYFGTTFFSQEKKQAVWAIYVWCRRTDDIVDSPLAAMLGPERMEEDLRLWKERLDRIWVQEPTDALDMALSDAKKNYPSMDIEPY